MDFLHKGFLATELSKWSERRLITRDQAEHIASLYNINLDEPNSRTNAILRIVAYFFFGCSLMVLVGANWDELPRFLRLIMLLLLTAFVNLAGFWQLQKQNENYGTALLFLATLVFGASIALIAQIYHLGRHMPDGILLWTVGAFATALIARKSLLGGFSLCIALVWFYMEQEVSGVRPVGLLIFIALGLLIAYFQSGRLIVVALFVSIFSYIFDIDHIFESSVGVMPIVLSYCLLGVALSYVLLKFERIEAGVALHATSIFFGVVFLLASLFAYEQSYAYYGEDFKGIISLTDHFKWLFTRYSGLLFTLFCVGSAGIAIWLKRYVLAGIAGVCFILPIIGLLGVDERITYSLACVLVGGAFIKLGRLGLGLLLIFGVAGVRYFELVGDYIGTSVLFLVFAFIMLALTRKRRAK